ncbi:MAG: type I-A CRISPR-associated protein Cas7/Csa2 [bacterium]|nr:type I-A CRISPR-associated protein Cas7/Csa2 [bacterium]
MFLSLGIRFEANVEAMNMVETTGNYSKHRRVPYIIESENLVKIIYVPAVSGESIDNAYQEPLAMEARAEDQSVCTLCTRGEFLKSMDQVYAKEKFDGRDLPKEPEELEQGIVKKCTVEDVGGFLYAGKPPIKRTSAFQVSYALPIKNFAVYSMLEPQLHARHAQLRDVEKREEGAAEQMIYYVEIGTAIYGFVFNLDLMAIGMSALTGKPVLSIDEIRSRRRAAIKSLARMVSSGQFGAKLSRFFPLGGIRSLVLTATDKPFTVTSPIYEKYEETTLKRLEKISKEFSEECKCYILGKDGLETPEDAFSKLISYLREKDII